MTLMYDSVDWQAIPADAAIVAGYVDGKYVWPKEAWDRFTNAFKLRITVTGATLDADAADIEKYDLPPAQGAQWVLQRPRTILPRPWLYCSRDTRPAVAEECALRGLAAGRDFDWWISTLDGTISVPDTVAVQYTDAGPYDLSIVTGSLRGNMGSPVILVTGDGGGVAPANGKVYLARDWPFGTIAWITEPDELPAFQTECEKMQPGTGTVRTVPQGVLDRQTEIGPITSGIYVKLDPVATAAMIAAVKAELDQLVASTPTPVNIGGVAAQLEALSKHLGVGTA